MENVVLFEVILLDMLACCYIFSKDQPRDLGGDGHCGLQGYIEIFIDRVCVGVVRPNYATGIFDKSLISSWERREGGRHDVSAETLADISEVTTI